MYEMLKDRDAYFLYAFTRSMEDRLVIEKLKTDTDDHLKKFPRHRFIFLCNAGSEFELLSEYGLNARFINHNCFVDERIFTVEPGAEKAYDAVYDAQLSRVKRHYLASGIESLALITYLFYPGLKEPFVLDVLREFEKAHWFNKPYGRDSRVLAPGEVADALNRCRVGLCLSAEEGDVREHSVHALRAARSIDEEQGRAGRIFRPPLREDSGRHARCGQRGRLGDDRQEYPGRTCPRGDDKKMTAHRDRFIDLVQGIYGEQGIERDFRQEWEGLFFNKMLRSRKIEEAVKILSKKGNPP